VEWRCFNSTLHAGRAAAYVNLCLAMSAQAIAQRSTVMRKTKSDNELFTFRVWLVRMGLNGPEFKNTREHLLICDYVYHSSIRNTCTVQFGIGITPSHMLLHLNMYHGDRVSTLPPFSHL
jgi:hypothetical protein